MDIFTLVRQRTLDVLASLADRGVPPRDPGRVMVAAPRAGAPGDVVIDVGPTLGSMRGVADGLGAAPEVACVAAVGGGRIVVTLRPATILEALAAVLAARTPVPTGRDETVSPADRARPARGAASLAELRAEVLAEMRDALAGTAGRGALTAAAPLRRRNVVLGGEPPGAGPPRPDADAEALLALIGADAFRFAVASCRPGAALHLDLRVLGDRCRADPAFWVPYAHARARRVLRRAAAVVPAISLDAAELAAADLSGLTDGGEAALARLVVRHAQVVAEAAAFAAPQKLAAHLREVADAMHHQWNRSKDQPQLRFVNEERRDLTKARLGLVTASALVLRSGLGLLGLSAPDEML